MGADGYLWIGRQGPMSTSGIYRRSSPHVRRRRGTAAALAPAPTHLRPRSGSPATAMRATSWHWPGGGPGRCSTATPPRPRWSGPTPRAGGCRSEIGCECSRCTISRSMPAHRGSEWPEGSDRTPCASTAQARRRSRYRGLRALASGPRPDGRPGVGGGGTLPRVLPSSSN